MDENNISSEIISVRELLQNKENIAIPNYQRPYKWTTKNVNQLIDDILIHKEKSEYRLGTLVLHNHDGVFDIVDGQQRTITLTLIAHAIIQKQGKTKEEEKALKNFDLKRLNLSFANDISKANIQNNFKQIERRIADFDEKLIWFFLEKCTLVKVVLSDISEAFQFFDSQNARGKDLEPHDLLKAFHLREMNNFSTEEERKKTVEKWESMDTAKLSKLFSQYLFRIRNWSKGNSARYFSKDDVDIFKGVSPDIKENYPFEAMLRIAHFYVEEYNISFHRNIDKNIINFPFQIDETIINGKRFFEMIEHYQIMIDSIKSKEMSEKYHILNLIKTYDGSFRTGDKYIRNLFYCGLIYYIDKFVERELEYDEQKKEYYYKFNDRNLSKAIEKIFVWAYSLRLKLQAVGLDSVDNYALNQGHSQIQLFKIIKEAIKPNEILNLQLETLKENKSSKTEKIVEQFKSLNYYE
ncbi:MAG TPA: DUF262 domain-containing protein [Bacteroidales bacterium]|jgi:hypothetical protein|nr:DUF262 domain-containing protein [Bacteroidales bacterium]HCM29198.1 hypothetical protein [Bacteroidales bacterium]HON97499.1 DUF262 domain-containing protein [Bacteroidales bacterium]